MRRRVPRGSKPPPTIKRPEQGLGKQKHPPRMRALEAQVEDATRQRIALQHKLRGMTYAMIGEAMDCNPGTAKALVSRGLDEYLADRDEVVQRYFAVNLGRYDQVMRTWMPRALGGVSVDPDTAEKKVIEPDHEAARIVLRAMRDLNLLISHGQAQRIEVTGASGGPIVTAAVDAMERARMVREAFGDAAVVEPGDDPASSVH